MALTAGVWYIIGISDISGRKSSERTLPGLEIVQERKVPFSSELSWLDLWLSWCYLMLAPPARRCQVWYGLVGTVWHSPLLPLCPRMSTCCKCIDLLRISVPFKKILRRMRRLEWSMWNTRSNRDSLKMLLLVQPHSNLLYSSVTMSGGGLPAHRIARLIKGPLWNRKCLDCRRPPLNLIFTSCGVSWSQDQLEVVFRKKAQDAIGEKLWPQPLHLS